METTMETTTDNGNDNGNDDQQWKQRLKMEMMTKTATLSQQNDDLTLSRAESTIRIIKY